MLNKLICSKWQMARDVFLAEINQYTHTLHVLAKYCTHLASHLSHPFPLTAMRILGPQMHFSALPASYYYASCQNWPLKV